MGRPLRTSQAIIGQLGILTSGSGFRWFDIPIEGECDERKYLKTLSILFLLPLAVLAFGSAPAHASGHQVAFIVHVNGQGVGGVFALFSDGTAAGNVALSAFNGALILQFHPETWTSVPESIVPGQPGVSVCGEIQAIRGEPPSSIMPCSPPFPMGATPVPLDLNGDGTPDITVLVTVQAVS